MSLVAVCHRFHNCMCPSNSIPLYIIRHCGRLAPSYKSRFNVLPSALLNWMAFALGQRHIAFSRDPVIRRILFTPGPEDSIYQVEYFLLEYCEYMAFLIPWLKLWGTSILWHKCYILLIGLFISSENTAIQQIF